MPVMIPRILGPIIPLLLALLGVAAGTNAQEVKIYVESDYVADMAN